MCSIFYCEFQAIVTQILKQYTVDLHCFKICVYIIKKWGKNGEKMGKNDAGVPIFYKPQASETDILS